MGVRQEGLQVVVVVEVVLDGHPGSFRQEVDFGYHHDQRLLVDLLDSYLVRRGQIRLLCLLSLAEALEPLIMKAMTALKPPRKAVVFFVLTFVSLGGVPLQFQLFFAP